MKNLQNIDISNTQEFADLFSNFLHITYFIQTYQAEKNNHTKRRKNSGIL